MAGGGNAIRGSRVGAGPMGEAERGDAAPRQNVTYFCSREHRTMIAFAVEAQVPDTWDCPRCGLPASLDCDNPPPPPKPSTKPPSPRKTPLHSFRRWNNQTPTSVRCPPSSPALPRACSEDESLRPSNGAVPAKS